jgi:hypothetical protein
MPKEENCGNCGAYIRTDDEGGECHRNAPVAQMDGAMRNIREVQTTWPYVLSEDWCYQFVQGDQHGKEGEIEDEEEE